MKRGIVVAGAIVLSGPIPAQAQEVYLGLSPQSGAPGDEVLVSVGCPPGLPVAAWSDVLDIGTLTTVPDPGTSPRSEAVAVVRPAAPGGYEVEATCGRAKVSADFTVTAGG